MTKRFPSYRHLRAGCAVAMSGHEQPSREHLEVASRRIRVQAGSTRGSLAKIVVLDTDELIARTSLDGRRLFILFRELDEDGRPRFRWHGVGVDNGEPWDSESLRGFVVYLVALVQPGIRQSGNFGLHGPVDLIPWPEGLHPTGEIHGPADTF